MKKVSIVILNWNGSELLRQFLPSVLAHSPADRAEVVVADNGSSDDSIAYLKSTFPEVRLITLDRNYGFAEGYNRALEEIDTEYTVLLNSDVVVTPNWLDAPLAVLANEPTVAAVQPKIRAERKRDHFEYAGAAGGYLDRYGYPFCRGRILHCVEKDEGQYDQTTDVLWASGACLFIRTAVYKEAGGLDATFFAHQEEIDLCWRLRCRGYRLVCTPQSLVYHVGGATLEMESPRKTFLNFRNNLLMIYKNLPEKEMKAVMRFRFWADYLAAAKFLFTGHPRNARAVYEARKAFYQLKPTYEAIRRENRQKTTNHSLPEIYRGSLLIAFYLKGKKGFKGLKGFKGSKGSKGLKG
ncbi:glycosyltransferase family 2 protein [Parabacteroides sp. PF5-6]|uniref:glycosyltransferase family 2 protein n=1 Tax=Parabacteroides sp. PF5-6 TaxID=1742403 RepID=UPI0024075B4F|nr:glycosyltransferase family 2 protein [Parabacteroides sp. PF5-6]MDF9828867.1 GT2 family glycosyltransferase [Parabacteroides sp. PF5-6]